MMSTAGVDRSTPAVLLSQAHRSGADPERDRRAGAGIDRTPRHGHNDGRTAGQQHENDDDDQAEEDQGGGGRNVEGVHHALLMARKARRRKDPDTGLSKETDFG